MKNKILSVIDIKVTIVIGVALCATPFFASAQAQNSTNTQAQTLLEIQQLRQEVGQLRDMVERQQYQMRKLQRALNGAQRNGANPGQFNSDQFNSVPPSSNSPSIEPNLGQPGGAVVDPANVNQPNAIEPNASTTGDALTAAPITSGVLVSEQTDRVAAVSEAVITAPPVTQTSREYPPVVDLSVGNNNGAVNSNPSSDQQAGGSVPTGAQVGSQVQGTVSNGLSVVDINPIEVIDPQASTDVATASQAVEQAANAQTPQESVSEADYYQQGFNFLKQSKHDEAVEVFKTQISTYPKGDRADDAYYWIAESMYVNRKLDISKENFKAIVQNYPKSERLPDAMLKIAYIEQEQGNVIEARILLQEILQFHPRSNAAISAKNRLAEIK